MAMSGADLWPYVVLVLVGFLPNEIWRWLGVIFSSGLSENSEIVVWVRAVATALLAGVIAKITMIPPGALATVPASVRLTAIVIGFLAFLAIKRSVFAGVVIGEGVLVVGALLVR
jgi:Branched-chain amino acid transport protein (AzlD)